MKGIYVIKSEKHFYIGLSGDLEKREREHWYRLKNNNHPNPKLQSVFNKGYNLEFEIIQECEEEDLEHLEKVWFDLFCIFYPDKEPLNLKECGSRPIFSNYSKLNVSKGKIEKDKYDFEKRYILLDSITDQFVGFGTIDELSIYFGINIYQFKLYFEKVRSNLEGKYYLIEEFPEMDWSEIEEMYSAYYPDDRLNIL